MIRQKVATRSLRIGLASRQALVAYIFLLPSLVYFSIFYLYPIAIAFLNSLWSDDSGLFVGFQYYLQAWQDARVWNAWRVTILFVVGVLVLNIVGGLVLAMLLDRQLHGRVILRTLFLIPYIGSGAIEGLMWRNMLDPVIGILNRVLQQVGLPPQSWLINYNQALFIVILFTVWQGMGYTMLLFLAGLQNIPLQYYDVARVDGANTFSCFRFITLPLLMPTMFFVVTIETIRSLQAFISVYILTQGGPAEATNLYIFHVFNVAFNENSIGYASALAFIMFVVILLLTSLQLWLGRRVIEY